MGPEQTARDFALKTASLFVLTHLPRLLYDTFAHDDYRQPWALALPLLLAAYSVFAATMAWVRPGDRRFFQAFGWAIIPLTFLHFLIVQPASHFEGVADPYPFMLASLGGVAIAIPAFFPTRTALVLVAGWCFSNWVFLEAYIGHPSAASTPWQILLMGCGSAAIIATAQRVVAAIRQEAETTDSVKAHAEEEAAAAAEAREFDAILHDRVIAAFNLAALPGDNHQRASVMARGACDALEERCAPTKGTQAFLLDKASELGLTLDLSLTGDVTACHRSALHTALGELLTNVARHSGTTAASVSGHLTSDCVHVVVADSGNGYSVGSEELDHGLSVSVRTPWEAIGGTIDVVAAPGRGCSTTLSWQSNDKTPFTWPVKLFYPFLAVLAICAINAYILNTTARNVYEPSILPPMALLVFGALPFLLIPRSARSWTSWVVSGVTLVTMLAVARGVTPDQGLFYEHWYVSSATATMSVLAFVAFPRTGILHATVHIAAVACVLQLVGGSPGHMLSDTAAVYIGLAGGAGLLRTGVDRAADAIQLSINERAALRDNACRMRIVNDAMAHREARLLHHVWPALREVAAGNFAHPESARRYGALSAMCRDEFATSHQLSPEVREDIYRARCRGATVKLRLADPHASIDGVSELLADTLGLLHDEDSLVVTNSMNGREWKFTIRCDSHRFVEQSLRAAHPGSCEQINGDGAGIVTVTTIVDVTDGAVEEELTSEPC